jgi:stage II sporulation protein D
VRRSASALAALAVLAACGPRAEPVYGPVPPHPAPPPAPAPEAPPARPSAPAAPPPAAARAPAVRVGVAVDTSAVSITSSDRFVVRTENGRVVARLGAGQTARFTRDRGGVSLDVVGGRGQGGLALPLVVEPEEIGVLETRGGRYRGALVVQGATRGGGLTLVNRLDMESYLLGVVPREIGRASEDIYEAVKAQAVAARTYAVKYIGRRSAQGFDVYPTVEDQVYGGVAAEDAIVFRAVAETAGEILTHAGEPITAYYHSTCAGQTAAIDEVWNERPVPYLVSVRDVDPRTGEAYDRASSRFRWTERWTHAQLVGILNRTLADSLRGRRIGRIEEMDVTARTASGRVRSLVIDTDAGRFTVGRDRVRWILTPTRGGILNSSKFDVRMTGGEIVAEGGGWGHGIGMCQVGAMGRARAGQDYREILGVYYPGTRIRDMY